MMCSRLILPDCCSRSMTCGWSLGFLGAPPGAGEPQHGTSLSSGSVARKEGEGGWGERDREGGGRER